MDTVNAGNLVERVIALLENKIETDLSIVNKIEDEFGITNEDAESALELTKTGLFRAQIIAKGNAYPKNNLQDNPIVKAALKMGLEKLGRPELYKNVQQENQPWWKIW